MKLRLLSDLHLEHDMPSEIPVCDADLVILAGDIANGREGVDWAARTFDVPVVYVPGNHEYYESNFALADRLLASAAAEFNHVIVLNGGVARFTDGDGTPVRVIGTTWWTDYQLFGADRMQDAMTACASVMVDHRLIHTAGDDGTDATDGTLRLFTPADALARHLRATAWLESALAEPFEGKTVVVTHHGPDIGSLDPRYAHDIVSAGFLSQRPDLVMQADLWVHGHTHTGFDYRIGDARVVCNPRGYRSRRTGEMENPRFDWNYVVEV
ncbi:metallophosphoesterase [Cupriavidus plantarum]|uniref:metallophosphoesterase n=1 Tax=Cupriavidus plantarum TaxID=942865 RepID=UPI000E22412C|nr:metallophosphoesterase [Cupriavidus plantarum]REF02763.1 calcineurin-like phosphoesterase family protein [Cupriavidus plantarum]RLK44373.1 calcineurin-like phosphoesterase family protein [Cupriavidus plantarum]